MLKVGSVSSMIEAMDRRWQASLMPSSYSARTLVYMHSEMSKGMKRQPWMMATISRALLAPPPPPPPMPTALPIWLIMLVPWPMSPPPRFRAASASFSTRAL